MNAIRARIDFAIEEYGREQRKVGFAQGIRVAETILAWLNRKPDRKWQKQIRGWAETTINNAKKQNGMNLPVRGG